jgi:hypothetical protein
MRYDMVIDHIKDSPLGLEVPFTKLNHEYNIGGRYNKILHNIL